MIRCFRVPRDEAINCALSQYKSGVISSSSYYLRVDTEKTRWRIVLPYLLAGLFASGIVLSALAEFHEQISDPWLIRFDLWATQAIHQHTFPAMTALMLAFSFLGSMKVYLALALIVAVCLRLAKYRRQASLLFLGVTGAAVLNTLLKVHFRRLRPDVPWALAHEHSFSFPSGHSTAAFALYGMLTYLLIDYASNLFARLALFLAAIALVLGIGMSRIYLGAHFPSDVVAGYLVGFLWLATLIGADMRERYLAKRSAQCLRCH